MKNALLVLLVLATSLSYGQDMKYAKDIVGELSKDKYFGRGYINKGDSIAADFLKHELKRLKLKGFTSNYEQPYTTPVNRYIKTPKLTVGDRELKSSFDFIVYPTSPSCKGTYDLVWINKDVMTNSTALAEFLRKDLSNSFLVIDSTSLNNKELYNFTSQIVKSNVFEAKGIIKRSDKLKFTAKTYLNDYVILDVVSDKLDTTDTQITVDIESDFIEEYQTQNLVAYIPGKTDSCIIFSAHYDHLGMLGDVIYPGANDNASGVSLVLNFAKYFNKSKSKPKYTLVFLLVSGEEAGLLGSKHYADNPIIPLEKTKFVFNFDMLGRGSEGVYVINSTSVPEHYAVMEEINAKKEYIHDMHGTGESSSSDHASFHDKGVPAVFFYTHGTISHYHEPTDTPSDVPYSQYEGIFKLVRDFVKGM